MGWGWRTIICEDDRITRDCSTSSSTNEWGAISVLMPCDDEAATDKYVRRGRASGRIVVTQTRCWWWNQPKNVQLLLVGLYDVRVPHFVFGLCFGYVELIHIYMLRLSLATSATMASEVHEKHVRARDASFSLFICICVLRWLCVCRYAHVWESMCFSDLCVHFAPLYDVSDAQLYSVVSVWILDLWMALTSLVVSYTHTYTLICVIVSIVDRVYGMICYDTYDGILFCLALCIMFVI